MEKRKREELVPRLELDPPDEIPRPPGDYSFKYRIDDRERIVRVDFSTYSISAEDEAYVFDLFERPDVTVIIKGLGDALDPRLWSTRYLLERCGELMYHNFRRFCQAEGDPGGPYHPVPELEKAWSSMSFTDYVRYLDLRAEVLRAQPAEQSSSSESNAGAKIGVNSKAAPKPTPKDGKEKEVSDSVDKASGDGKPTGSTQSGVEKVVECDQAGKRPAPAISTESQGPAPFRGAEAGAGAGSALPANDGAKVSKVSEMEVDGDESKATVGRGAVSCKVVVAERPESSGANAGPELGEHTALKGGDGAAGAGIAVVSEEGRGIGSGDKGGKLDMENGTGTSEACRDDRAVGDRGQAGASSRGSQEENGTERRRDGTEPEGAVANGLSASAGLSNIQAAKPREGESQTLDKAEGASGHGELKAGAGDGVAHRSGGDQDSGGGGGSGDIAIEPGSGGADEEREACKGRREEPKKVDGSSMEYVSFDGKRCPLNVLKETVYLTDMDMTRYLPECADNLSRRFKMDLMPAGAKCALQYVARESRPFLGPNLYITPPGSYTQFHQDGNGTVDSAHQCLVGRNKVIMLRRMDDAYKRNALKIISGCSSPARRGKAGVGVAGDDSKSKGGHESPAGDEAAPEVAKRPRVDTGVDLGGMPCGATEMEASPPTSNGAVKQELKESTEKRTDEERVSRGVAEASRGGARGRGVKRGRGRPRSRGVVTRDSEGNSCEPTQKPKVKEEREKEQEEDPLYKLPHGPGDKLPWPDDRTIERLRQLNYCPSVFTLEPGEFVHINKGRLHTFRKEHPLPGEDPGSICVSVAWDWVFQGVSEAGCRQELGYALSCAKANREAEAGSLAPVETCLLQASRASLASVRVRSYEGHERQAGLGSWLSSKISRPAAGGKDWCGVGAQEDKGKGAKGGERESPSETPRRSCTGSPRDAGGDATGRTKESPSSHPKVADSKDGKPCGGSVPGGKADQPLKMDHVASRNILNRLQGLLQSGLAQQGDDGLREGVGPGLVKGVGQDGSLGRLNDENVDVGASGFEDAPAGGNLEKGTRRVRSVTGTTASSGSRRLEATTPGSRCGEFCGGGQSASIDGKGIAQGGRLAGSEGAAASSKSPRCPSGGAGLKSEARAGVGHGRDGDNGLIGGDDRDGKGNGSVNGSADVGGRDKVESTGVTAHEARATKAAAAPMDPAAEDMGCCGSGGPGDVVTPELSIGQAATVAVQAFADLNRPVNLTSVAACTGGGVDAVIRREDNGVKSAAGNGLGRWVSNGVDGASLYRAARAAAHEAAVEVLEKSAPAAARAAAHASTSRGAAPAIAASAAASAAKAAMGSAQLAASVADAALKKVRAKSMGHPRMERHQGGSSGVNSDAGRAGGNDNGRGNGCSNGVNPGKCSTKEAGSRRTAGCGGVQQKGELTDRGVLSALVPLLEDVVAGQRKNWYLEQRAVRAEERRKVAYFSPCRPGKRKLGPAAAKQRDQSIMASIARMELPLRKAVSVTEVDASVPNHLQKINPFVDDGYACASCRGELFNAYMHCYGCETLLGKDLNLCLACHAEGRLAFPNLDSDTNGLTDRLHCSSDPVTSQSHREYKAVAFDNTGVYPASRCHCEEPSCRQCHLCVACACDCHHRFQLRFRFERPENLERMVQHVRDTVGGQPTISPDDLKPLELDEEEAKVPDKRRADWGSRVVGNRGGANPSGFGNGSSDGSRNDQCRLEPNRNFPRTFGSVGEGGGGANPADGPVDRGKSRNGIGSKGLRPGRRARGKGKSLTVTVDSKRPTAVASPRLAGCSSPTSKRSSEGTKRKRVDGGGSTDGAGRSGRESTGVRPPAAKSSRRLSSAQSPGLVPNASPSGLATGLAPQSASVARSSSVPGSTSQAGSSSKPGPGIGSGFSPRAGSKPEPRAGSMPGSGEGSRSGPGGSDPGSRAGLGIGSKTEPTSESGAKLGPGTKPSSELGSSTVPGSGGKAESGRTAATAESRAPSGRDPGSRSGLECGLGSQPGSGPGRGEGPGSETGSSSRPGFPSMSGSGLGSPSRPGSATGESTGSGSKRNPGLGSPPKSLQSSRKDSGSESGRRLTGPGDEGSAGSELPSVPGVALGSPSRPGPSPGRDAALGSEPTSGIGSQSSLLQLLTKFPETEPAQNFAMKFLPMCESVYGENPGSGTGLKLKLGSPPKSASGSTSKPSSGSATKSGSGSGAKSGSGSRTKSGSGSSAKSRPGSSTKSGPSSSTKSGPSSSTKSSSRSASKSGSGSSTKSGSGSSKSGSGSWTKSGSSSPTKSGSGSSKSSLGSPPKSGPGSSTKSGSGSSAKSGTGCATKSGSGSSTKSGSRPSAKSGPGSSTKSGPGSSTKSGPGSSTKSGPGSSTKSASGSTSKVGSGSAAKSAPGVTSKSDPRSLTSGSGAPSKASSPGAPSKASSGTPAKASSGFPSNIASGVIPKTGPGATPKTTPGARPKTTPGATPKTTPGATPKTTPGATPKTTPGATPKTTPGATPKTTPGATPKTTPGATPKTTPGATPKTTPGATSKTGPGATPKTTPRATSKTTLGATPKTTPGATPKTTPGATHNTTTGATSKASPAAASKSGIGSVSKSGSGTPSKASSPGLSSKTAPGANASKTSQAAPSKSGLGSRPTSSSGAPAKTARGASSKSVSGAGSRSGAGFGSASGLTTGAGSAAVFRLKMSVPGRESVGSRNDNVAPIGEGGVRTDRSDGDFGPTNGGPSSSRTHALVSPEEFPRGSVAHDEMISSASSYVTNKAIAGTGVAGSATTAMGRGPGGGVAIGQEVIEIGEDDMEFTRRRRVDAVRSSAMNEIGCPVGEGEEYDEALGDSLRCAEVASGDDFDEEPSFDILNLPTFAMYNNDPCVASNGADVTGDLHGFGHDRWGLP